MLHDGLQSLNALQTLGVLLERLLRTFAWNFRLERSKFAKSVLLELSLRTF